MPRRFPPTTVQAAIVATVTMLGTLAVLRSDPDASAEVTVTYPTSPTPPCECPPPSSPTARPSPTDTATSSMTTASPTRPTPQGQGELAHLDPALEASLTSTVGPETSVEFRNDRAMTVKVYWLDYSGRRIWYASLAPGAGTNILTYVGHPWVVTDQDERSLFVAMPSPFPGVVLIT